MKKKDFLDLVSYSITQTDNDQLKWTAFNNEIDSLKSNEKIIGNAFITTNLNHNNLELRIYKYSKTMKKRIIKGGILDTIDMISNTYEYEDYIEENIRLEFVMNNKLFQEFPEYISFIELYKVIQNKISNLEELLNKFKKQTEDNA